jgi:hypothetical protein
MVNILLQVNDFIEYAGVKEINVVLVTCPRNCTSRAIKALSAETSRLPCSTAAVNITVAKLIFLPLLSHGLQ